MLTARGEGLVTIGERVVLERGWMGRGRDRGKFKFLNSNVGTIAGVIVHPQFRAMGIASWLVRRICEDCPTRYVEAIAVMGEVVPFFERAGMRRAGEGYFLWERG